MGVNWGLKTSFFLILNIQNRGFVFSNKFHNLIGYNIRSEKCCWFFFFLPIINIVIVKQRWNWIEHTKINIEILTLSLTHKSIFIIFPLATKFWMEELVREQSKLIFSIISSLFSIQFMIFFRCLKHGLW